jgi:hypothetical protein
MQPMNPFPHPARRARALPSSMHAAVTMREPPGGI